MLAEALKSNTTLTILTMWGIFRKKSGKMQKIIKWWIICGFLDNGIGDEGAKALSEALRVNTELTYLGLFGKKCQYTTPQKDDEYKWSTWDVKENRIGKTGGKLIGEALKCNKSLNTLILGSEDLK